MGTILDYIKVPTREEAGLRRAAPEILNISDTETVPFQNSKVQAIAESYSGKNAGVEKPMSALSRYSKIRDILYQKGAVNTALGMEAGLGNMAVKQQEAAANAQKARLDYMDKAFTISEKAAKLYGNSQDGVDVLNSLIPGIKAKVDKRNVIKDGDLISYFDEGTGKYMKSLVVNTDAGYETPLTFVTDDPLFKGIEKYPETLGRVVDYYGEMGTPPPPSTIARWKQEEMKKESAAKIAPVRDKYIKQLTKESEALVKNFERKLYPEGKVLPPEIKTKIKLLIDEYKKLSTQMVRGDVFEEKGRPYAYDLPIIGKTGDPGMKYKIQERQKAIEKEINLLTILAGKEPYVYEINGEEVGWDGSKIIDVPQDTTGEK